MALPVQITSNSVSVAALTNVKAFAGNVTAGNLIFVVVGNKSGNFPNTVTDSQGNAYTFWDLQQSGVAATATTWFAVASATGPCTVTTTYGSNEQSDMVIAEYKASGGVPALDNNQSITNATTAATSLGTGNITTTLSSDMLISWAYDGNRDGSPWTDSAGGTREQTTSNPAGASLALFDKISGAPGVQNDTMTATTGVIGDNIIVGIIAFKNIAGGLPAPSVSCNSPQVGHVGQSYSHTFPGSGGTPPYTFAISAGSLPPGLSLGASTGIVSGTPTTSGVYNFTIQVTDSAAQIGTAACSITINAQNSGPAFIDGSGAGFFATGQPNLFTANGALYAVVQTFGSGGGNINGMAVFKSTNSGDTWTQMDAAHAPTSAVGWPVFDSSNNRLVFGLITVTNPVTQQALFLKPFNFSTDTWGANFATGGPVGENPVQFTFLRPDGSFVVLYDTGSGLNPGGTTRLRAAIWNGITWSASIDVGAAILPLVANGNIAVASAVAAMDTGGNIHVAFNDTNRTVFMYQLLSGTTLGSSHQFTETFQVQRPAWGSMLISGNNVLISGVTNNANNTLFTGTGLSAPAWTSASPAAVQPATAIRQPGPIALNGSTLIWMLNFSDPVSAFADAYQLAQSTDGGVSWTIVSATATRPYLYDLAASQNDPNIDNTFATSASNLTILSPSGTPTAYAMTNARFSGSGINAAYFMTSLGLSAPVVVSSSILVSHGGGTQVARGGCRPLNHYDWCLWLEMQKFRRIRPLPPCSVPMELWNIFPWEEDFGSVPAYAVPFRNIHSIVTPATAAGDTAVSQLIVPQGYDGIITGFYWRYNGLNFVEGSGDIIWRIRVNMRFVKDLSNVGFTLGSPQTPVPMLEGGQLLQSRQQVTILVNIPNLSGTIQIGTSTVTAGLFGFFWPKGVPAWTSR